MKWKVLPTLLVAYFLVVSLVGIYQPVLQAQPPKDNLLPQKKDPLKIEKGKMIGEEKDDDPIIPIKGPEIGPPPKAEPTPEDLEGYYQEVWVKIAQKYYDLGQLYHWIDWKDRYHGKLKTMNDLEDALKEMAASLGNRWTLYRTTADIGHSEELVKLGYVGIGASLYKHKDGKWHIDFLTYGSPAQLSSLREGDIIKAINGQDIEKMFFGDVEKLLHGKVGEQVTIVPIYDDKEQAPVVLTFVDLKKETILIDMLPGKIAYIRLPSFMADNTTEAFTGALVSMYKEAEGEMNGIIFDLRNNPGGRFDTAREIISLFVEKGIATKARTRDGRWTEETSYLVVPTPKHIEDMMHKGGVNFQRIMFSAPLVVLTNGSSASASEVTTGALQDNGRAFVIGTHTFGKAVGYSTHRLPAGGVLRITGLSYLTPKGTDISGKGIVPNLEVKNPRDSKDKEDKQLEAAQKYILDIVKERNLVAQQTQETAINPQDNEPKYVDEEQPTLEIDPWYVVLGITGTILVICVSVGLVYRRRVRKFIRRRFFSKPSQPTSPVTQNQTQTS